MDHVNSTPSIALGRRAFTLLELLIAVAMISALAGLIFPTIKIVRSSAKSTQCAGNLRQIVTGIFAYTNDHRGGYPAGYWGASSNQYVSWDDQLAGLDGREQLAATATGSGNDLFNNWLRIDDSAPSSFRYYAMYTCPLETTIMSNNGANCWVRSYAWPSGYQGTGRGRGNSLTAAGSSSSTYPGMYLPVDAPAGGNYSGGNAPYAMDWAAKTLQVTNPSTKILLAEIRYLNDRGHLGGPWGVVVDGVGIQTNSQLRPDGRTNNTTWNSQISYQASSETPTADQRLPLHRGKWNYLFADGRCELLSEAETAVNSSAMWKRN